MPSLGLFRVAAIAIAAFAVLSSCDRALLKENCICHHGGERCPCDRGAHF
jgi:hypothetical protein